MKIANFQVFKTALKMPFRREIRALVANERQQGGWD